LKARTSSQALFRLLTPAAALHRKTLAITEDSAAKRQKTSSNNALTSLMESVSQALAATGKRLTAGEGEQGAMCFALRHWNEYVFSASPSLWITCEKP
jgi:hypothetical protein